MSINTTLSPYQAANQLRWVTSGRWRNRTIADEAIHWAEKCPDDLVIYLDYLAENSSWSYSGVLNEAWSLAAALHDMGLQSGDVVSFQLPNWREVAPLNIAASLMGLILCPIIPIYRSRELTFILKASGAKVHFTADTIGQSNYREMLDKCKAELTGLREIIYVRPSQECSNNYNALVNAGKGCNFNRPSVSPDSVKVIFYTSGTTGVPKGVLHTHNTVRRAADNMAGFWNLTREDVVLMPSPVTHLTGFIVGLEIPFCWGNKTAFMEKWNAEAAIKYIHKVNASISVGATPFLQELLEQARRIGDSLPGMRIFACGGAAVPPTVIENVGKTLSRCRAFRLYGSSETPVVTQGFLGDGEEKLAAHTDGKIIDYDVKIVGNDGATLPPGKEGEILSRGPAMFIGYADPAHNLDACDQDGYWRSGDLGMVTPEGAILVTGRKKDIIIRGGENLSAKEIEDVLNTHPQVREAVVVSMPHARLGEAVCAFVIPVDPNDPPVLQYLLAHCDQAGLARQKWPERLELVNEFPRTPSGKIKKTDLRELVRRMA